MPSSFWYFLGIMAEERAETTEIPAKTIKKQKQY